MTWFRPLPQSVTRPVSYAIVFAWVGCMTLLVNRGYLQASPGFLSENLARYGPTAVWHGVYYRGEKIGFTVRQTTRTDEGFELLEEGQLQMSLLGATTAATMRTAARVDASFELQSFEFSLDPGTGAIEVRGRVERLSPSSACAAYDRRDRVWRRHANPGHRAGGATRDDAELFADAGQCRPGSRFTAPMDAVRPGDAQ